MDMKTLQRILQQAREDASFFHALVFEPERVLPQLGFLDDHAKEKIGNINPGSLIAMIVGEISAGCDENTTCSCTSGTCDGTCGGSTCDVTCSGESCGRTCDNSCGYTTHLEGGVGPLYDPSAYVRMRVAALRPDRLECSGETCACTSGYTEHCGNTCTGVTCEVTSQRQGRFSCTESCQATCGGMTCMSTCSGETRSSVREEEWR